MSYRTVIEHALRVYYTDSRDPSGLVEQLLARYDAEHPGPEAYPGELDMLRGTLATLHVVAEHGDLDDVRKLLAEHRTDDQAARAEQGKSSRTLADATPGLTERQTRLLDAIRTHGGEWTTRRVLHLFALTDPGVVQRGAARRDLAALQRAGHLVLVNAPDNRHYVLSTRKDGAL